MNLGKYKTTVISLIVFAIIITGIYLAHFSFKTPELDKVLNTPISQVPFGYVLLGAWYLIWIASDLFTVNVTIKDGSVEE